MNRFTYQEQAGMHLAYGAADDLVVRKRSGAGIVWDIPGIFVNIRLSMHRRQESCVLVNGRNFQHLPEP